MEAETRRLEEEAREALFARQSREAAERTSAMLDGVWAPRDEGEESDDLVDEANADLSEVEQAVRDGRVIAAMRAGRCRALGPESYLERRGRL